MPGTPWSTGKETDINRNKVRLFIGTVAWNVEVLPCLQAGDKGMAERGGFEPPLELPPEHLSRVPPSAARPPLLRLHRQTDPLAEGGGLEPPSLSAAVFKTAGLPVILALHGAAVRDYSNVSSLCQTVGSNKPFRLLKSTRDSLSRMPANIQILIERTSLRVL